MVDAGTSSTGDRRRLGPGLTAFIVVDVLLVVAVLVVLAAFLSGGDGADDAGVDGGAQPAPAATDRAAPDGQPETTPEPEPAAPGAFALPSGNIACEITESAATCTVAESSAEPVPVEGCAGAAGQVVTVTADGVSTPCVQGALPGPAAPGTPVLEYGRSMTSGDFSCTSAETGVTCRHVPTGEGFSLARAGHQVLG